MPVLVAGAAGFVPTVPVGFVVGVAFGLCPKIASLILLKMLIVGSLVIDLED